MTLSLISIYEADATQQNDDMFMIKTFNWSLVRVTFSTGKRELSDGI